MKHIRPLRPATFFQRCFPGVIVSCVIALTNINGDESMRSHIVSTHDNLYLRILENGTIDRLTIADQNLAAKNQYPFSAHEILPPDGKQVDWGAFTGSTTSLDHGIRFDGTLKDAALSIQADFVPSGDNAYIEIRGHILDLTGQDRAIRLSFSLPAELTGWRWENTAFRSETMTDNHNYPNLETDVMYMDRVGPREGKDPMISGLPVNKLPYVGLAGPNAAFALACPTHEPRIFLMRAATNGVSMTFSLGLSPETKHHPSSASFRVLLYRIDPAWGIRSAAERYRAFFPELFASANRRHGNYTVVRTFNPKWPNPWPENAADFGFLFAEQDFQKTNGEMRPKAAAEIQRLGLIPFHWRGPWYYFHSVKRGLSLPAQLALLRARAEGRALGAHGKNNQLCGCPDPESARGAFQSCLINERGQLDRGHYPKNYDCYLMAMNMNPDLPKPSRASLALDWQYRYIQRWDDPTFRGPRNFAWDALDDWGGHRRLNFRREHFAYEQPPLIFQPETGRLCIHNGFTHWAFARLHSSMVHNKGGLIMCNVNLEQAILFCGPFIDIQVKERPASRWDDERLSVERMLAGPKPISFLGGKQPPSGPELEAIIRKVLLFGITPGTTGKEIQRELMKKYMPAFMAIGPAGWQPVTHARTQHLPVERFGSEPGQLFFTLANRDSKTVHASVHIDTAALNIHQPELLTVHELIENRPVTVRAAAKRSLDATLTINGGETLVLAVDQKPGQRASNQD